MENRRLKSNNVGPTYVSMSSIICFPGSLPGV
jgi:hypothetical protein